MSSTFAARVCDDHDGVRLVATISKCLALALALVSSAVPSAAHAAPSSRLTFVRGPRTDACPGEDELRRSVAARLGYDPFFPWAERTVIAELTSANGAYHAKLSITDAKGVSMGERLLPPSRDCGELVKSLALAISIALDDLKTESSKAPEPEPAVEPELETRAPPAASSSPVAELPRVPEPEAKRAWAFGLHASGSLSFGIAPAPSWGVAAGARFGTKHVWAALDGRFDAPASADLAGGGRVVASTIAAEPTACIAGGTDVRPFVCATAALGSYRAKAERVEFPREATSTLFAIGGRLGVDVELAAPVYVFAHGSLLVPTTPHRLSLNGAVVWEMATVGGAVALGAGVWIP